MVGTFIYNLVVFLHIMLAILAVGLNLSYVVWIRRGTRDTAHLSFALKGVKFLDDYLANPAYLLLAVSGVVMIALGKSIQPYLWLAIGIYAVAMAIAYGVYTPLLSRQIKTLDAKGAKHPEYLALARRSNQVGQLMGLMVVVILGLKILKPDLW